MDLDSNGGNKRVFQRLGGGGGSSNSIPSNQKVCYHWRAGRCTRSPCNFLHREVSLPPHQTAFAANGSTAPKRFANESSGFSNGGQQRRTGPGFNRNSWGRVGPSRVGTKADTVCNFWVQGSCKYADKCRYLHSWSMGDNFSLLTQLEGHQKLVSGIALPSGSDKLFTASKDETLKAWDCVSGQCMGVIPLGGEAGCMISEGPWLFVGMRNTIKVWNTQTSAELTLTGPVGEVYAMVVGNDLLFAGTQDGSILAWRFNAVTNCFEPAASLGGHTRGVVSLYVGANRLYSGSMDHSIKVWNLETLQCIQTLQDHSAVVTSLICWEQFLLSCSLDNTIKVWVATESGNLEVTFTHTEEHGLLSLCGMHDGEAKPVLLCSCNDDSVRLYDLPSFSERGKIFAKDQVRTIQIGPGGLFFTGDGSGQVRVWKWSTEPSATSC